MSPTAPTEATYGIGARALQVGYYTMNCFWHGLKKEATHAYGCLVKVCVVRPLVYEIPAYYCALVGCGKTLITYVGTSYFLALHYPDINVI